MTPEPTAKLKQSNLVKGLRVQVVDTFKHQVLHRVQVLDASRCSSTWTLNQMDHPAGRQPRATHNMHRCVSLSSPLYRGSNGPISNMGCTCSLVGPMGVRYCSMPPLRISHLKAVQIQIVSRASHSSSNTYIASTPRPSACTHACMLQLMEMRRTSHVCKP